MNPSGKSTVRIAILDLYEGQPNQGMRCIREIINQWSDLNGMDAMFDEFEVRLENKVPDTSYDIYISSGGPGDPTASIGSDWENEYFSWLKSIEDWNANPSNLKKKYVFFICHSYQVVCRHYKLGLVSKRNSTAFGVFPVHMLEEGFEELVFDGLNDPFYIVDSRDYQVTQPDEDTLKQYGAIPLCIEKERPHVPYERAVMAIRFNEYMIGTQFHPEADPVGMKMYLETEPKKSTVIDNHGIEKWQSMVDQLNDPDKIIWTYHHILPNFLNLAVGNMVEKVEGRG